MMEGHPGLAEGSPGSCPFSPGSPSTPNSTSLLASLASLARSALANPSAAAPLLSLHTANAWASSNALLRRADPLLLVLLSVSATILLTQILSWLGKVIQAVRRKGLGGAIKDFGIALLKRIPGISARILAEQEKLVHRVQKKFGSDRDGWITAMPQHGLSAQDLLSTLDERKAQDKAWQGKCSGTVYMGGASYADHMQLMADAYMRFAHTNPLHPDIFPSVVRMENEAVAMTASILGAGAEEVNILGGRKQGHWPRRSLADATAGTGEVCGNITSGGTESILMAVRVAREYMREHRGVHHPELIMAQSAHAAYNKACGYFGITLRIAPVGPDYRANVAAVRSLINSNTIMIVGSAPGFPHGVVDDIQALGCLALRHGVCLHVDCCLGGFVLPFAQQLGYKIPPFDFRVPGVTSISVDTHKYGLAPKGTSVILYRTHALRRFQYVAVTDWSGGLYVSPSVAGSRSGGLIAGAWAALVAQGQQGFLDATKLIMEAATKLKKGIASIEGLKVLGDPETMVVAFGTEAAAGDVYKINDAMTARGWHLNALQNPPSVHMCVTLQHVDVMDKFLEDLRESADEVRNNPKAFQNGMAPVYGAAAKIPDRAAVGEFLVMLMESM